MYRKAERNFRAATTPADQLRCLEEMLRLLPKHKGTDKLQADLKRKISEKRNEVTATFKASLGSVTHKIARQGCAQIAVVGAPNSGKSQLVASLTAAKPTVAPFPYTSRSMTAGMMTFEDVSIQLVDTPPLAMGTLDASLLNLIRSADMNLLCFDGSDDESIHSTIVALEELRSRSTYLSDHTTIAVDGIKHRACRGRLVLTRALDPDASLRLELLCEEYELQIPVIKFDSSDAEAMTTARAEIFRSLNLVRVYTKRPGEPADRSNPFTLPLGATIQDVAAKVHADLPERVRDARIWHHGISAEGNATSNRLSAQTDVEKIVGHEYPVQDCDIVELRTK